MRQMIESKKKKVTLYLSDDEHARAKERLGRERSDFQKTLKRLFDGWLNESSASLDKSPHLGGLSQDEEFVTFFQELSRVLVKINKKDWKWLEMLAAILASGNKKARSAVTENLNVFHEYVELHANNGTASNAAQPETAGQSRETHRKNSETTRRTKSNPERGGSGIGKTGTDGG